MIIFYFKHMASITSNYNEEYKKVYIPTCIEYSKIIHINKGIKKNKSDPIKVI